MTPLSALSMWLGSLKYKEKKERDRIDDEAASKFRRRAAPAVLIVWLVCAVHAYAGDEAVELPKIEVVGTVPATWLGHPARTGAFERADIGTRDLARQRTGGVAEFLNFNANSVSLNSPTGNALPTRREFSRLYRLLTARHSAGLSVFQDGVRINEAFADVVNWDLLPKNAVSSMQLLPGSNPVFGLNTLGGALTIHMKDGFAYPDASVSSSAGSFGRTEVSADAGGNDGTFGLFVAVEGIHDNGYRDHFSTRIQRLYGRATPMRDRTNSTRPHPCGQPSRWYAGASDVDARESETGVHLARHHGQSAHLRQRQLAALRLPRTPYLPVTSTTAESRQAVSTAMSTAITRRRINRTRRSIC